MLAQAAARQRQQQGTGSAGGNGGGSSGALAIGEQEKMSSPLPPMTNRAGESKSPYVLAHKDGPVHWQPLNDKTVERARREGKLIFMNIGFRACHCKPIVTYAA